MLRIPLVWFIDTQTHKQFVDALVRDTVAPAAMGKRGMQSQEAMGVSAYEALDQEIHGQKVKHAYSMNEYDVALGYRAA